MPDPTPQLKKLESEVEELRKTVRPGQTPAFGITLGVGVLVYAVWLLTGDLPGDPDLGPRVGVGVASAIVALIFYGISVSFVIVAFKVLVEIGAALLLLGSMAAGIAVWRFAPAFEPLALELFPGLEVEAYGPLLAVYAAAGLSLLGANLVAVLALYPLAKTAGTKLD